MQDAKIVVRLHEAACISPSPDYVGHCVGTAHNHSICDASISRGFDGLRYGMGPFIAAPLTVAGGLTLIGGVFAVIIRAVRW